jgi:quercetin 2,3-dioxygenase
MDDPRYGTVLPDEIPIVKFGEHTFARVMAGRMTSEADGELRGPFQTVQDVQMIDYNVFPLDSVSHFVPIELDNSLMFVYAGEGTINGQQVSPHDVIRFDASTVDKRGIAISAGSTGLAGIIFSGKMLRQPIAWHGPFVMTTDQEIKDTIKEYRSGTFLKKRADWDYKRIATKPSS